MLRPTTEEN